MWEGDRTNTSKEDGTLPLALMALPSPNLSSGSLYSVATPNTTVQSLHPVGVSRSQKTSVQSACNTSAYAQSSTGPREQQQGAYKKLTTCTQVSPIATLSFQCDYFCYTTGIPG